MFGRNDPNQQISIDLGKTRMVKKIGAQISLGDRDVRQSSQFPLPPPPQPSPVTAMATV
jgi:hypothetical protein